MDRDAQNQEPIEPNEGAPEATPGQELEQARSGDQEEPEGEEQDEFEDADAETEDEDNEEPGEDEITPGSERWKSLPRAERRVRSVLASRKQAEAERDYWREQAMANRQQAGNGAAAPPEPAEPKGLLDLAPAGLQEQLKAMPAEQRGFLEGFAEAVQRATLQAIQPQLSAAEAYSKSLAVQSSTSEFYAAHARDAEDPRKHSEALMGLIKKSPAMQAALRSEDPKVIRDVMELAWSQHQLALAATERKRTKVKKTKRSVSASTSPAGGVAASQVQRTKAKSDRTIHDMWAETAS